MKDCLACFEVFLAYGVTFYIFLFLIISKDLGSNLKHETSLIISTLFLIEKSKTKDFLESIDNKSFRKFFFKFFYHFFYSFPTHFYGEIFDPGLVDSPPMSIISAPELIIFLIL